MKNLKAFVIKKMKLYKYTKLNSIEEDDKYCEKLARQIVLKILSEASRCLNV